MSGPRTPGLFDDLNLASVGGAFHLNPEEYDDLIAQEGNCAELRRAVLCPCVRLDERTPRSTCPHCDGLGRLYPEDMRSPLIVLDASRSANLQLANAGLLAAGQISVTFPRGYVPARGDLVYPEGDQHVVLQTLWRQSTTRTTREQRDTYADYGAIPLAQIPRTERLLYRECELEMESVHYLAGEKLHCARPNEYRIEPDGRFVWLDPFGPGQGEAFSLRYRADAAYMVGFSVPLYRHGADRDAPYRAELKRLDKISPEDLR